MFYDDDWFKLPCSLKPAREMEEDLGHLYQLVAYLQDLQKRGTGFKFYQRNELPSDSSSDEMDYSKTSAAVKPPAPRALKRTPPRPKSRFLPSDSSSDETDYPKTSSALKHPGPRAQKTTPPLPKSRPAIDNTVSNVVPVTVSATTTSHPPEEQPPAPTSSQPTADNVQPIANDVQPIANNVQPTANEVATSVAPAVTAVAATTSQLAVDKSCAIATSQPANEHMLAPAPAFVAPRPSSENDAGVPVSITPTTSDIITATAPTPSEQSVAKRRRGRPPKAENANEEKPTNTKKRKRNATRDPKSVILESLPARPAKKKKKVIWWRQTIKKDRMVPYYDLSDWVSGDEVTLPREGGQLADDGKTPAKNDKAESANNNCAGL